MNLGTKGHEIKGERKFMKYRPYKSRFMESYLKDLKLVMDKITLLFKEYDIDFTFIGGAASNFYNLRQMTDDIDILVDKKDREKIENLPIGFIRALGTRFKRFIWNDPKTDVEIIYSGEISGDGINGLSYSNPKKISNTINGIPVLSLKNLIMYKLSSGIYGKGREKDFVHIKNLIKSNKLQLKYSNNFRDDLDEKYQQLWNEVQDELNNPDEINKW